MALLIGCDFSSRPARRKPILIACGRPTAGAVTFESLHALESLDAFSEWLRGEPAWLGGFDFPFGLPRALVQALGWLSYKSDDRSRQNPQRRAQRERLLDALQAGQTRLGLQLHITAPQYAQLVGDPSGDKLDAALCMMQAAWGFQRGWPDFGLPMPLDPLEGWIVTALPQRDD